VSTPRAKKYLANKKFRKYALSNIPLGRIATESDVATAITYLSSNASSMITGSSIVIDGGWTAK
jgi:NAD(P)-dependent dehydrogenase (short-subunit alcohol dehydrogenase family)